MYRALACTQEVWILQRYLDMTIDPDSIIRKQDGSTVIGSIAANSGALRFDSQKTAKI